MKKDTRKPRTSRGIREYSYLGCPLTRNRSAWCFRICTPDEEDRGRCGRLAPHTLKSNIQQGIENHNRKKLERLERMCLDEPE